MPGGFLNRPRRLAGSPATGGTTPLDFSYGQDGGAENMRQAVPMAIQGMLSGAAVPSTGGGPNDFFRAAAVGNNRVNQVKTEIAQKAMQDRQVDLEDIGVQQKLMSSGRPVIGGMVEEDQLLPDGSGVAPVPRPADKSRVVKHKTRDGKVVEVELYTEKEIFDRHKQQKQAEEQAKIAAAVEQQRQLDELGLTPAAIARAKIVADEAKAQEKEQADIGKEAVKREEEEFKRREQNAFTAGQNDLNRTATAATAAAAAEARNKPVPGRDIPLPDAVFKQQLQKAAASKTPGEAALPEPTTAVGIGERNEQYLSTLDQSTRNRVVALVEGRYPVPSGGRINDDMKRIVKAAAVYEPGFDLTRWKVRGETIAAFKKGRPADNIRSLNTLIHHTGRLMNATKKLDNSNFTGWNWTKNELKKRAGGNPNLTSWNIAAQAVESEAVTLFKGTGATNQEIEHMRSNFNENATVSDQVAAIKEVLGLSFGRMHALDDQWKNSFQHPRHFRFLNPTSQKVLKENIGIDPDEVDESMGTPKGVQKTDVGSGGETPEPTVTVSGGVKTITPEKAFEYMQKANGDRAKAMALAKADGYTE